MPKVLYVDLLSQPCRSVVLFSRYQGFSIEEKYVDLMNRGQDEEEIVKLNPLRAVPILDDNGFILTESVAIMRYLATTHGVSEHWYPSDRKLRARVDECLAWHHTHNGIRPASVNLFFNKVVKPAWTKKPFDESNLPDAFNKLEKVLNYIETYYLTTKFLIGSDVTIADIVVICEIMQVVSLNYDVCKKRPKLESWMTRVKERLGSELYDKIHAPVLELGGKHSL